MIRKLFLAAALVVCTSAVAEAATPVLPTVAQYSSQQEDGSSRTRVRGRSVKGVVKLVGLGAIGVIAVGGWVLKKVRGE